MVEQDVGTLADDGFSPACALEAPRDRARQLLDVFSRVDLDHEDFLSRRFTRLKQIEYLVQTAQIDETFMWKPVGLPQIEATAR